MTTVQPGCSKCGSHHTRIIGQSGEPSLVHYRCEACGHVFSRARGDEDAKPSRTEIDKQRIERLVKTVIADFDLPFELLSVLDDVDGWRVIARTTDVRRVVRFN